MFVCVRDGQMDSGFICSNEATAPVRRDQEGAKPEGEAFNLLLHLCPNPLGSDQRVAGP